MAITLDELRNLDLKEAGEWPMPMQLLATVLFMGIVVLAGGLAFWQSQLAALYSGQQTEITLKQAFLDKKTKSMNLAAYQQQLLEIQHSFGTLLKQLPNQSEMATLLTEVHQAGARHGLSLDLFKPNEEVKTSQFVEVPIQIRLTGPYHNLSAFVSDLAGLPRIVTFSNIQLSALKNTDSMQASAVSTKETDNNLLLMEATVKTYRALGNDQEHSSVGQTKASTMPNIQP